MEQAVKMDHREFETTIKQLQKTVALNEAASNVLAILERLKKEARPTEDMLRATRAGVFVTKLRHNANKDIARIAGELVARWKKLVEAEKNARMQKMKQSSPATPSPSLSTAALPASATKSASGTAAASASPSSSDVYKGNPDKRTHQVDGINIKRTGDVTRDGTIGLLYNGLAYRSTLAPEVIVKRAVEVELAAMKHFGGADDAYKKKMRSLFHNLKVKSNKSLGEKVMSGKISPDRFVAMTQDELKSDEQRKKEEDLQLENMKKAHVPMAEKSISDALKCGRCGQKKVSYSQAQTRSADEPMTTFCECTVCGNRWKFS